MAIWTPLIKEFIMKNKEGTAIDILKWINEQKKLDVRLYISQQIDKMIIEDPYFTYKLQPWGGIDKRYCSLMKTETISQALNIMYKNKQLNRREISSSPVKWMYFKKK